MSSVKLPFSRHAFEPDIRGAKNQHFTPTERSLSSASTAAEDAGDGSDPTGDLFDASKDIGPGLIGQTASIRRTFGPMSNAQCMLTCGGEKLAAHASFDPDYLRAQDWIRHHAVGPAVLSPVLVTGLVGALVEAAFPQSVPVTSFNKQIRPLIVGVAVNAKIKVEEVVDTNKDEEGSDQSEEKKRPVRGDEDRYDRRVGYQVNLTTAVTRVRDDAVIAEGRHSIWIPDYLRM